MSKMKRSNSARYSKGINLAWQLVKEEKLIGQNLDEFGEVVGPWDSKVDSWELIKKEIVRLLGLGNNVQFVTTIPEMQAYMAQEIPHLAITCTNGLPFDDPIPRHILINQPFGSRPTGLNTDILPDSFTTAIVVDPSFVLDESSFVGYVGVKKQSKFIIPSFFHRFIILYIFIFSEAA